jgi:hypothetical protein
MVHNYNFFSLSISKSFGLNHMRMVGTMWSSMLIEVLINYRKDQIKRILIVGKEFHHISLLWAFYFLEAAGSETNFI